MLEKYVRKLMATEKFEICQATFYLDTYYRKVIIMRFI